MSLTAQMRKPGKATALDFVARGFWRNPGSRDKPFLQRDYLLDSERVSERSGEHRQPGFPLTLKFS